MTAHHIMHAPLYAVGVYTPDADATAKQYERVFGVVPQDFGTPTPSAPDGSVVAVKMNVVFFPNFYVKLQQPVSPNGPHAEGLRAHGMSIQNLQLQVDGTVDDIRAIREVMERDGGRWTLGIDTDMRAYVDFGAKLGVTLEPINVRPRGEVVLAPDCRSAPLGASPVTHVGFAVADVAETASAFGQVFGIPVPPVRETDGPGYPPGSGWDEAARLRIARWRQGEIDIELIESVGGATPWSECVAKRQGTGAHVLGFDVGDRMDETLRDLLDMGGKWIFGAPGGNTIGVDFTDTLGLIVQITGKYR